MGVKPSKGINGSDIACVVGLVLLLGGLAWIDMRMTIPAVGAVTLFLSALRAK